MVRLVKIFVVTMIAFNVASCSSDGELCVFGTWVSEDSNYKRKYWRSTLWNKSKASKHDLEKCNQEAENIKVNLEKIFLDICSTGHISQENLAYAISIQHNYLEGYHFGKDSEEMKGTIDQIFTRFFINNDSKKASEAYKLKLACARYIPKDGIYYDYKVVGPDSLFYKSFNEYNFEQCMLKNNFELIVPTKKTTYCKGIMW
ncbi:MULTISPECIES: hypothetical protein [unclassified Gilliamella]|uniref:hypothetical protein n=1 Tax=unclassified Gilliamella TaxID=2685620 RepID=UPI001C6A2C3E|nr:MULTISPECIES: hypothetical protein [unclassified Gilliamella]MCX8602431.1 hypothetical protein [Gilliamella sp. B3722]MCX8608015.1 hypothetical protein [Gilliamella sp. B3771]MCX8611590.1 hypothetical protein [Gilliamella sp. B3891]MCX8614142.1 hypothetical protein [Gilliamella sp. B3773]MCX8621410.1 hypothetical protein [Gilliamella sp. B3892]